MRFTSDILLLIILLTVSSVGVTLCAVNSMWIASVIFLAVIFFIIRILLKKYEAHVRKLRILLEAVENNDYSFRFPEKSRTKSEHNLNLAFNGMRELLAKAKSEVIEKEKFYELILARINTGIIIIDEKGFVCQINESANKLLGMSVLTHITQLKTLDESFPELFDNLLPDTNKNISFYTERGTRSLNVEMTRVIGKDKVLRIISLNDIESELDENEIESWIRLTRVLTHEIMNGISPITSLSGMLLKKENISTGIKEGLEVINHTGNQLTDFVTNYRKFTRIPEPNKTIFELGDFLNIIIRAMKATTDLPVRFKVNIEPSDLMIYADRNLISQIITNIIKNAIQAFEAADNPYISITASTNEKDHVIIDIDNNGKMIDPEVARQIFVPFFTTKENGSGIGLSVSKQIMRYHNGMLKLTYSTEKETRFSMVFR